MTDEIQPPHKPFILKPHISFRQKATHYAVYAVGGITALGGIAWGIYGYNNDIPQSLPTSSMMILAGLSTLSGNFMTSSLKEQLKQTEIINFDEKELIIRQFDKNQVIDKHTIPLAKIKGIGISNSVIRGASNVFILMNPDAEQNTYPHILRTQLTHKEAEEVAQMLADICTFYTTAKHLREDFANKAQKLFAQKFGYDYKEPGL